MTEVTIIQLSPDELEGRIARAIERAIEHAAKRSGETWRTADLAAHYGVSERTILNRMHRGELPPRTAGRWLKADVLRAKVEALAGTVGTDLLYRRDVLAEIDKLGGKV